MNEKIIEKTLDGVKYQAVVSYDMDSPCPRDGGFDDSFIKISTLLIEEFPDIDLFIFPIYLYKHGLIKLSTKPFSCAWDSHLAGDIAIPMNDHENEEKAGDFAEIMLREYETWLNGEVYQITIKKVIECQCCGNGTFEELSSTGGYLGDDNLENIIDCEIRAVHI